MEPVIVERRYPRKPRKKSSPLVKIIFYLTSLLPAIWIAWRLDLANEFNQRLKSRPQPRIKVSSPPVLRTPTNSIDRRRPEEMASERQRQPPPRNEVEPTPRAKPIPVDTADSPVVLHVIDLDLREARQRHLLADSDVSEFRVTGLKSCEAPYTIRPLNGRFDEKNGALVVIDGPREIVLRLGVRLSSDEKTIITIEPQATTDAGDKIPFTLEKLTQIRGRIIRDGKRASSDLDAMMTERQNLVRWINAPRLKALAAVGEAKTRVMELDDAIPQQQQFVASLESDLDIADALTALANHLDEECRLQISTLE